MTLEHREVIKLCAGTNLGYMVTTPAGQVNQYPRVRRIYERLAIQGYACAEAWMEGRPPPPHEAGLDAFWWAVAAWAGAFMNDLLKVSPIACAFGGAAARNLQLRALDNFYQPHLEFASYLRPRLSGVTGYDQVDLRHITPGRMILMHDAKWTALGVGLAVRWRPLYLVTDPRTLWEALRLSEALRNPMPNKKGADLPPRPGEAPFNPVAWAYLESDLVFLRELFGHFAGLFSDDLNRIVRGFLNSVEIELRGGL